MDIYLKIITIAWLSILALRLIDSAFFDGMLVDWKPHGFPFGLVMVGLFVILTAACSWVYAVYSVINL